MTSQDESSSPLIVKLCSDKAAFEVRTKRQLFLNINEVRRKLEGSAEHKIVIFTPHVVILKSGNAETTLSKDGRMLVKRVSNEAEATEVAIRILQTILK